MKGNAFAFLLVCLLAKTLAVIHVERSGMLPLHPGSFGIQFYITVANDKKTRTTVESAKKPKCCWIVEKGDVDCNSMKLIGGLQIDLQPTSTGNITFVFPNQYPMDRVGSCNFVLKAEKRVLVHTLRFDTTEKKKTGWMDVVGFGGGKYQKCSGVDLDPRKECKPVDCVEKYNGKRSFFRSHKKKCEPTFDCYTKMKNGELPEIAFDKDANKCKSLLAGKLTKKQEKLLKERAGKSSIAQQMASLEDIKEINPVPLNCHHGRRVGSVCVCDEGWKTDTSTAPLRDLRFIFDWCNVNIEPKSKSRKYQTAVVNTGLSLIAISLLVGWASVIYTWFVKKRFERFMKWS